MFDYHPLANPAPYNHSSVDCDEIIYYASGNFMSRPCIEERSVTLHAAGAPHGPLRIAETASTVEDPHYFRSWVAQPVGS